MVSSDWNRWGLMVRSPLADYMLDQAEAFRQFLMESFKDGKSVLMSDLTNDGSMYYLLNLIASQQV